MPDDWSWFWAGENGRDNLLRDEIEGLQSRAYAASQQSAQLSSQLRRLQGSIESRLQALSVAFDAYVELGDVREQLAGYPDTSAVRRQSLRALSVLEQGGVPEPLAADPSGYWLVDATNEVIALTSGTASGTPDRGSGGTRAVEETPAGPGTEHETFVVAALGWLGHGERAGDRVARLLLGDGALAAAQVVLWRALVHGRFGDAALVSVREPWQRDLDLAPGTWDRFVTEHQAERGPVGTLRWVAALVDGRVPDAEPAPGSPGAGDVDQVAGAASGQRTDAVAAGRGDDDRTGLRRVVDALVGAGTGDERALLERARVLRTRIENPGSPVADPTAEPPRTPTTRLVQEALVDPHVGGSARAELVRWVRPGLEAAVGAVAAEVAAERPEPRLVHTEMGQVEVSGAGVDEARLAELDAGAVERFTVARSQLLAPAVAGGVALLAGLVLLATDHAGLGVVLVVVAVVLAVIALRAVLRGRAARAELADVRHRTRRRVEEGRTAAAADEATDRETKAEVATLARSITGELPATSTTSAAPAHALR